MTTVTIQPRLSETIEHVDSVDPSSSEPIRLRTGPDGMRGVEPDGAVATMILTREHELREDASLHFCEHVHHFASPTTAEAFVGNDARRYVVNLPELDAAAERLYARIWCES